MLNSTTKKGIIGSATNFGLVSLMVCILSISIILSSPITVAAQTIISCAAPNNLGSSFVTVNADQQQVNVRSGPNSYQYEKVGILLTYESAPALGRSPGGDWFQILCPGTPSGTGWVYSANVTLTTQGDLPIIEIPMTSTPLQTATVDPALAAEFPPAQSTHTRLPTYTPISPYASPTFVGEPADPLVGSMQGGLIIVGFFIGIVVLLVSYILKR